MARPRSDHFDGVRFVNPTLPEGFSITQRNVFRMSREPRKPWPAWVENEGVPRLNETLGKNDVAITFVNHATFLIQTADVNLVTDPMWSKRASPFRWIGPKRVRAPAVAFDALPKIDIVLLSHNHYDHLDRATLARLKRRFDPHVLAAAGDARVLRPLGLGKLHELDWWQSVVIGDSLKFTFVPAQHFSARGLFDRQMSLWGGYMIEARGRRIYFGGDCGYSTHFADIAQRLGAPDVALLGIGSYEPRWFMQPMHMNPAEAVRAHRDLGSKHTIGMHFGTFRLSAEAFDQPLTDLKQALADANIPETEFITLREGETRIY